MFNLRVKIIKHAKLQTTITSSLPKPAWLSEPLKLWAPWKLEGEVFVEGKRDAVSLALYDQEKAGIDIVSDGEKTRRHFVTAFIEHLEGVDFKKTRTVRIRDRQDAKCRSSLTRWREKIRYTSMMRVFFAPKPSTR